MDQLPERPKPIKESDGLLSQSATVAFGITVVVVILIGLALFAVAICI